METIIVTRHKALVEYIHEIGLAEVGVPVLSHATTEEVMGKHVIGVLPLLYAALAAKVTEVPLALTAEMRGKELTLEEVRSVAMEPVTYKVTVVRPEGSV